MCQGTTSRLPRDEFKPPPGCPGMSLRGATITALGRLQSGAVRRRAISDRGGSEASSAQGVSAQFCSVIHTLVHGGGIPWCW